MNRYVWRMGPGALVGTVLSLPYAALATPVLRAVVSGVGGSAAHASVALLIVIHAVVLAGQAPATARGFGLGAGLLALSILARGLDGARCPVWPFGTHFLWHLLNALMPAWMIEVLRRLMLAARGPQG